MGGCGGPSLTLLFSFRAFYLERSNLPTDASTTAVKIDQVCPFFPHLLWNLGRAGGLPGWTVTRVTPSQNAGWDTASAVPSPGRLLGSPAPSPF